MCILATKEQLDELIANCTNPEDFSILRVDPTFNLGNIYVTPLVYLFKDNVSQRSKNPLKFVGPLLIYHTMEHTSYHWFFCQMFGQLPEFCRVKAFGSDGETALCKAIETTLPGAVHWCCIMLTNRSIIITIFKDSNANATRSSKTPPIVHYAPTVPGPSTSTPVLTSTRNQSFYWRYSRPISRYVYDVALVTNRVHHHMTFALFTLRLAKYGTKQLDVLWQ